MVETFSKWDCRFGWAERDINDISNLVRMDWGTFSSFWWFGINEPSFRWRVLNLLKVRKDYGTYHWGRLKNVKH